MIFAGQKFWDKMYARRGVSDAATISSRWDDESVSAHYAFTEMCMKKFININVSILDIGSGSGHWLRFCRDCGAKATGIELSSVACRALSAEGYDIVNCDIQDFETTAHYQVIIAVGVLHHIVKNKNLTAVLHKFSQLLADDGVLLMSTQFRNKLFRPPFYKRFRSLPWWKRALKHAGLQIETIHVYNPGEGIKQHDDFIIVRGIK